MIGVAVAAAGTAVNVAYYAADHNPFSMAAAVFCGLMCVAFIAVEAKDR